MYVVGCPHHLACPMQIFHPAPSTVIGVGENHTHIIGLFVDVPVCLAIDPVPEKDNLRSTFVF